MTATFETLMGLDAELQAAGHHGLTSWWKEQLARWYAHPTARTLVARVGRGGTKSHISVKVALNEVIHGDWFVPPGEQHFWAYVSTTKDEAAQRLNLIERFLIDLGLKYERNGDQITVQDEPRGWRVFAATVASVSGFRCFGATGDELCKWKSADKMANPAGEVMASINAMTVTHPGARRLLVSSPLGMTDHHYKRFALGDTADQLTCEAPTWIANPSITEQQTHELEPDPRIWSREYAARPQAGALSVFEPEAIVRAFQWPSPMGDPPARVCVIDASSGRKDSWTWGVCGWRDVGGRKALVFDKIEGFVGTFWAQKSGEQIIQAIAEALKAQGIRRVFGDQRESFMIGAAFSRHYLTFQEMTWTAPSKERAVGTVRRWLADGMVYLPEHEKLKDELLEFEERTTAAGGFTFAARGTGHDDFVALLLTAAMADAERKIPGSPSRRGITMIEALQRMNQSKVETKWGNYK
ncbi:MAG: hypothetical protein WDO74_22270 [Pseudomonadota bacterium]